MQEYYRTILPLLGHVVVAVAETGNELVDNCRAQHPDMVITDIKMPDMDGIEAATRIYHLGPVPIVLVSAHFDSDLIRRAEEDHILSDLVKPIKQAELEAAIAIASRRFDQPGARCLGAHCLRQSLEDGTLIKRPRS